LPIKSQSSFKRGADFLRKTHLFARKVQQGCYGNPNFSQGLIQHKQSFKKIFILIGKRFTNNSLKS